MPSLVTRLTGGLRLDLAFEQGRWIAANAGILVSRVLYVKESTARRFVVVDAAMNDLIRPALYDAWHEIVPVVAPDSKTRLAAVDVVGPVCETGDVFAVGRPLPPLAGGRSCWLPIGGGLWRDHEFRLQFASVGSGGDGARRGVCRCAAAPHL